MNKKDIENVRKVKETEEEQKLLEKIHQNYRKANVAYRINIQKNKLNRIKEKEKTKKIRIIQKIIMVILTILTIFMLMYALEKDNESFMETCTQNMSESACRKGW